ncbi:MAG: hypothetical protein KJZ85_18980 [Rhodobacteraceae bacterium]|jgi:hypothetical protein|nr:hypothetical protein [Paracoccaceae bacterium]
MSKLGFYDLCRLLGKALVTDDELFSRFSGKAGLVGAPFTDRESDTSPWTGSGKNERPSDVVVYATTEATGRRWAIHIRNLVRSARLLPEQATDYPVRAQDMAASRGYDEWKTVLLVSQERLSDVAGLTGPFDAVILHHETSDRIPAYLDAL